MSLPPRVVLVKSLYGGNVGSTARAMANMGLSDLRLVQPQYKLARDVELMAKGASEILDDMQVFDSMEPALGDCTTVVACTARPRRWKAWDVLEPGASAELIVERASAGETTALLFGAEDQGLEQEHLQWATHLCHIPTGPMHSSLNLSQAVLLLAWEWAKVGTRLSRRPTKRGERRPPAGMGQVDGAAEQIGALMDRIDYFAGRNRDQSLATVRQILIRGEMTDVEVHFLRGVVNKLRWHLDHGPRAADLQQDE